MASTASDALIFLLLLAAAPALLRAGSTPDMITLNASLNPAAFGQPVTLIATVSPATATGRVVFYDNAAAVLGMANLSQGQASFSTRLSSSGAHHLTARYLGDAIYGPGISSALIEHVVSSAQSGFGARADYSTGGSPIFVAQGDLNHDGNPDLVVVNPATGAINVLLGSAAGIFTQAPGVSVGANANPSSVAIGDFNGDGYADLAVANQGTNNVTVFLANSQGGFGAGVTYAAGGGPASIAAADLNGDGAIDLVVADDTDGGISILAGNGDGTFERPAFLSTGANPRSLAIADFNSDGQPDIAVANSNLGGTGPGSITLLLGSGDGIFAAAVPSTAGTNPVQVVAADLNGDGTPDIVAVSLTDGTVSVLLCNPDGTLRPATNTVIAGANAVAIADFNGDGKLDLAVSGSGNQITILAGYGTGTFHNAGSSKVDAGPDFVVAGDFNGDGRADLAAANKSGNDVSVLLGAAPGSVTSLAASLNPSTYGQPVSFTATVSPRDATGQVTVYDGVSIVGSAPVANGQVVLASSSLAAGTHSITGFYSGDIAHPSSSSPALTQTVNALPSNGFQPPLTFPAGSNPRVIAAGDFNGDGLMDLAVANDFSSGDNTVNILLGTGSGFFAAPSLTRWEPIRNVLPSAISMATATSTWPSATSKPLASCSEMAMGRFVLRALSRPDCIPPPRRLPISMVMALRTWRSQRLSMLGKAL